MRGEGAEAGAEAAAPGVEHAAMSACRPGLCAALLFMFCLFVCWAAEIVRKRCGGPAAAAGEQRGVAGLVWLGAASGECVERSAVGSHCASGSGGGGGGERGVRPAWCATSVGRTSRKTRADRLATGRVRGSFLTTGTSLETSQLAQFKCDEADSCTHCRERLYQ